MNVVPRPPRTSAGKTKDRRIVAVASGKGGVGKTWFAITLAHALARRGRRTLLFDGDLGLANVDIQLGLMPDRDLASVLGGNMSLKMAVLKYDLGGFDIIAGSSGSGSLAGLPGERLDALSQRLLGLTDDYEHVIIDLGAGVDQAVRRLTRPAGTCVVVATDDPTSLTDAYAFIKLITRDYPDTNIGIVVNLASSREAGERTFRTLETACQNFLKLSPSLIGIVRRDDRVADSIRRQTPVLTRFPNCDAADDMESIAAVFVNST